jgi:hypothetical protein
MKSWLRRFGRRHRSALIMLGAGAGAITSQVIFRHGSGLSLIVPLWIALILWTANYDDLRAENEQLREDNRALRIQREEYEREHRR